MATPICSSRGRVCLALLLLITADTRKWISDALLHKPVQTKGMAVEGYTENTGIAPLDNTTISPYIVTPKNIEAAKVMESASNLNEFPLEMRGSPGKYQLINSSSPGLILKASVAQNMLSVSNIEQHFMKRRSFIPPDSEPQYNVTSRNTEDGMGVDVLPFESESISNFVPRPSNTRGESPISTFPAMWRQYNLWTKRLFIPVLTTKGRDDRSGFHTDMHSVIRGATLHNNKFEAGSYFYTQLTKVIRDSVVIPNHQQGGWYSARSPSHDYRDTNGRSMPHVGNGDGILLAGVFPVSAVHKSRTAHKTSSIMNRGNIYTIPTSNGRSKDNVSASHMGRRDINNPERLKLFEMHRLEEQSKRDKSLFRTPSNNNNETPHQRFRRATRSKRKDQDERDALDELPFIAIQSTRDPSTSGNISESDLSYKSAGQVGYIDSPSSIITGNGAMAETMPDHEIDFFQEESNSSDVVVSSGQSEPDIYSGVLHASEDADFITRNISAETDEEHEPDIVPEPEAEGESSEGTGSPESEIDGCEKKLCYAEPYPDWELAKPTYGAAWEFHVYAMGTAFGILAIYTLACMVVLRRKSNLLSKGYFMSLNGLLLVMGTTRSIYLLVDGYDSRRVFHPVLSYMLVNIPFPCMTSAFSILFLALLRATKMQILSKRIQTPKVFVGIIVFHFGLSFTVDIIVGLVHSLRVMFLVCQIAFILWGLFLFCGYFYLFWKFYKSPAVEYAAREAARQSSNAHRDSCLESMNVQSTTRLTKLKTFHHRVMLNLALKVTLSCALLGVLHIIIVVYGMVDVFNVFATQPPDPWPFWSYHFCIRVLELAMCGTMSFVATQPLRFNTTQKSTTKSDGLTCRNIRYVIPCYVLCVEGAPGDLNSSGDKCITVDEDHGVLSDTDTATPGTGDAWGSPLNDDNDLKQTTSITDKRSSLETERSQRPHSMLYCDSGLIRFRQEGDSDGDPTGASTENDLDCGEPDPWRYHSVVPNDISPIAIFNHAPQRTISDSSGLLSGGGRVGHWRHGSRKSTKRGRYPGYNTPGTPKSFCSTDFDVMSGDFNFRPPSSIHLRDSIDRALDYSDLQLRTPNSLRTVDSISLPESPDALRNSLYSYATISQSMKSARSVSPGRTPYLAKSFRGSSPSLSYKTPETVRSDWFQRYFWGKFANKHARSQISSNENSIDAHLSENCIYKHFTPLSSSPRDNLQKEVGKDVTQV